MNNNFLFLAIEAYYNVCKNGTPVYNSKGEMFSMLVYQQPSSSLSVVGRKYVHLRNCNGNIARYTIKTGEITV